MPYERRIQTIVLKTITKKTLIHHRKFVMSTGYMNETGIDLGSFEITCFKGSNTITAHPDSSYEVVTNDIGKKSFPFVLV